jgi:hypothetical protein
MAMERRSSPKSNDDAKATEEKLQQPSPNLSTEKWLRLFDAWINSEVSRNSNFDDSRESIYPDRS